MREIARFLCKGYLFSGRNRQFLSSREDGKKRRAVTALWHTRRSTKKVERTVTRDVSVRRRATFFPPTSAATSRYSFARPLARAPENVGVCRATSCRKVRI